MKKQKMGGNKRAKKTEGKEKKKAERITIVSRQMWNIERRRTKRKARKSFVLTAILVMEISKKVYEQRMKRTKKNAAILKKKKKRQRGKRNTETTARRRSMRR